MIPTFLRRIGPRALSLLLAGLLAACGGGSKGDSGTPPPPPPGPVDYTPASPRLAKAPLIADLQAISAPDKGGRRMGEPGNATVRAMLAERFQSLGLQSFNGSFERPFTSGYGNGVNVVGYLTGTQHPDKAILLTAHFDHIGTKNGQVVCGADDNASGTAAVLAIAAYLKAHPPAHTVIFGLFDGEELGLLGAEAFTANLPAPWRLQDLVLVENLDMIAQGTQGRIFVGGTSVSGTANTQSFLKATVTGAFSASKVKVVPDYERYNNQSDQGPFKDRGVPFLFFCVADDDPYYHTVNDTFDRIPQDFYWAVVEGALETLLRLDAQAALPTLIERPAARDIAPFAVRWKVHPWSRRTLDQE